MTHAPAPTPKRDANDNQWYWLATLYGESRFEDEEPWARNRVAWNRFMAGRLTDEARARLIEEGRYPDEELKPFTPDDIRRISRDFANRSRSPNSILLPTEDEINFSGCNFSSFFSL